MGDETDHQSVQRRLSEDKSIGDHAPMQKHDDESTSGAAVPPKEWVKFDEEGSSASGQPPKKNISPGDESTLNNNSQAATTPTLAPPPSTSPNKPAVLETETTHVNLLEKRNPQTPSSKTAVARNNGTAKNGTDHSRFPVTPQTTVATAAPPAVIDMPPAATEMGQMRTIELSTGRVREGFANGDVIVTLLPLNRNLPWITPPVFRPELVPEELMAQGLTLTVEEYVHAMESLVNDYRFTMYNICYKRILVCWILFAFGILLGLLFSGLTGITLFALGVTWLFMNMATVFLCMWGKIRLARGLEKCLARVNKQLIRHKILLVLDDRGRISCHKVNLCFIYFDAAQCVNYLNEFIEHNEQNGTSIEPGWEARLDLNTSDIVIQGANTTRVSRKQERGIELFVRYASRWGNHAMRGFLDVTVLEPARHCAKFACPCQFVEKHITTKPRGKSKLTSIFYWVLASEYYD